MQNYTQHPFANKEILEELFKGNKKIVDPIAGERHTSLAKIYITDSKTNADLYQKAEKDQPKGDTIKIWLHNDGSKWALKSGLTSGASPQSSSFEKRTGKNCDCIAVINTKFIY